MDRKESYFVYKFNYDEVKFCYNINTGKVYRLVETGYYDVKEKRKEKPEQVYTEDKYSEEELQLWKEDKIKQLKNTKGRVKSLCLVLSQDCNMRCVYCYEKGGSFGKKRSIMDSESLVTYIERWWKYVDEKTVKIKVSFYGGEPLLNKDGLIKAIDLINKKANNENKKVQYSMITNGTILDDDIINIIKKNKISLIISIDGNETSQNRTRILCKEKTSYNIVSKNVKWLLDNKVNIMSRMTLVHDNIDELYDSVCSLWEMGIEDIECIPVLTDQVDLQIQQSDLKKIQQCYMELADKMIENLSNGKEQYFENFMQIIYDIHTGLDHFYPLCGYYDCKELIITPEGEMYNCEKLIGVEKERVGNNGIIDSKKIGKSIREHNYNSTCRNCVSRRTCGGMCYADYSQHGNYMDTLCGIQKIQFQASMYIYAKMLLKDDNFWHNFLGG